MSGINRSDYLIKLDDEYLLGGAIISEWCSFIVREADKAFIEGAFLATILTVVSAVETYLRAEYSNNTEESLYDLINHSSIEMDLKEKIHLLRKYRNRWVHVLDPQNDEAVLNNPEKYESELENMAFKSERILRRVIYSSQCV